MPTILPQNQMRQGQNILTKRYFFNKGKVKWNPKTDKLLWLKKGLILPSLTPSGNSHSDISKEHYQ